jgi:hypothetical protein
MRRTKKLVVAVAAFTVATLVSSALPKTAEAQEANSIVYFPYGNGATYSCTGDAPFVFDSAGTGNCSIEQIGSPAGLVCNFPTTITFVHQGHQWVADASLCRSGTDARNLTTTTTTTTTWDTTTR